MFNLKNMILHIPVNNILKATFKSNSVKVFCAQLKPHFASQNVFNRSFASQTRNFTESQILGVDTLNAGKKRTTRKKWTDDLIVGEKGKFNVIAFASAEEYNLEGLVAGLMKQDLYEPKR